MTHPRGQPFKIAPQGRVNKRIRIELTQLETPAGA
jgi:hypothetical protein